MSHTGVPRLFVGGPWHGRVERIPDSLRDFLVPVPGCRGITRYHLKAFALQPGSGVFLFLTGGDESVGKVADAMARAAGIEVMGSPW